MNSESRICQLARLYLADDHQIDGVRFMDELLAMSADVGAIRCSMTGNGGLRFEVGNEPAWEMQLGRAKSKLRMLCARLGVLCTEKGSLEGTLYGGEGIIPGDSTTSKTLSLNQWQVRFANTTSEQVFHIQPGAKNIFRTDQVSMGAQRLGSTAMRATAEKISDQ